MILSRTHHNNQVYTKYKIELDKTTSSLGCIYLVKNEDTLLGTFYRRNKKWVANPHYLDYQRLPQLLCGGFEYLVRSNHLAIEHIIDTYEGK